MKGVMKVIVLCSLILHALAVGLSHPQPSLTLSRTPTDTGCMFTLLLLSSLFYSFATSFIYFIITRSVVWDSGERDRRLQC